MAASFYLQKEIKNRNFFRDGLVLWSYAKLSTFWKLQFDNLIGERLSRYSPTRPKLIPTKVQPCLRLPFHKAIGCFFCQWFSDLILEKSLAGNHLPKLRLGMPPSKCLEYLTYFFVFLGNMNSVLLRRVSRSEFEADFFIKKSWLSSF